MYLQALDSKQLYTTTVIIHITYHVYIRLNKVIVIVIVIVHCGHDCRYGTDEAPFYSENALVPLLSIGSPRNR